MFSGAGLNWLLPREIGHRTHSDVAKRSEGDKCHSSNLLSQQPLHSLRKQTERMRTVCLFLHGTINLAGKGGV